MFFATLLGGAARHAAASVGARRRAAVAHTRRGGCRRPRVAVWSAQPLEARTLLTTVSLTGTSGTDAFLAVVDPAGQNVQFYVNATPATGSPTQTVAIANLAGLSLDGGGGGSDTLTVATPGVAFPVTITDAAGVALTVDAGTVQVGSAAAAALSSVTTSGAGTVELTDAGSTLAAPVTLAGALTIDNGGSASATTTLSGAVSTSWSATITVAAGTLAVPASVGLAGGSTLSLPGPGTLSMPDWTVANATVDQTGGTVAIPSGSLVLGGSTLPTQYALSGGTLAASGVYVGSFSGGTFTQTGGQVQADHTELGTCGHGVVDQSGGQAAWGDTYLGYYYGNGFLNLSGTAVTACSGLADGDNGGTGAVTLAGSAALTASGIEGVGENSGTGTFTQTGGTNACYQVIAAWGGYGTAGTYTLAGGTLSATQEIVGVYGNGTFAQTGGTNQPGTSGLWVGVAGGATGRFSLSAGTVVDAGPLVVGYQQDAAATLAQTGGTLTVAATTTLGDGGPGAYDLSGTGSLTAAAAYVGDGGTGSVDQEGGSAAFSGDLFVGGDDPSVTGTTSATYTLDGSAPAAASLSAAAVYVGFAADAALAQAGGTVNTGLLVLSGPTGTTGTYTDTAGTLNSDGGVVDLHHPTADGGGPDATAILAEGSTLTLPLAAAPGAGNYPLSGWTVAWGDGSAPSTPGASATSASHPYTDGGDTDTAQATAVYGPGSTEPANPETVQVVDVPARITGVRTVASLGGGDFDDDGAPAGVMVYVTATFTDPGIGEHHQATVDWGDGSGPTTATVTESGGSGTVTASYTYADAGGYRPTLTITDDGGGVAGNAPAQATFPLSVQYVAPTFGVTAATPTPTAGGYGVGLTLTARGPDADTVTGWTVDWGDGSTPTAVESAPSPDAAGGYAWPVLPHVYATPGRHLVKATPTDAAGPHASAATMTLAVADPAVAGLTATAVDDNDVLLNWTPDPADGSTFEVDRRNPDGTWAAVATVDDTTGGDTYEDAGLAGATTFAYRVRAIGATADLDSPYATASVPTPLTTPDAPTGLTATESNPGEVDLAWSDDSVIVTGYIATATPTAGGTPVTLPTGSAATSFAFAGLTAGTGYSFTVVADNDQGNGHDAQSGPSAAVDVVAPAATMTATAPAVVAEGSSFSVAVASTLSGGGPSPIVSWQVNYDDTNTVDTVTGPGGTDAHLPATGAADVDLIVTATDSAGNTFTLPDVFVAVTPTAPTGLTATVASPTEVDLAWTDRSAAAFGDVVYASTDGGATFDPIGEPDAVAAGSANTYQATGLNAGTPYEFYVVADGGAAQSAPTVTVDQSTPFETPTVTASGSGTATEDGPYELDLSAEYPDGEPGAVGQWIVGGLGTDTITATGSGGEYDATADGTLQPNTGPVLHLTAAAVDPVHGTFAADPTQSFGLDVTVTPLSPGGLSAAASLAADGSGQVALGWANRSAFGTGTIVMMSTDGGPFFQQADVTDPAAHAYTVTGLTTSTNYQFELATDSVNGWSALTAPASAATPAGQPPVLTVTPYGPPTEGQPYQLLLSGAYAPGEPDGVQVDHWTVNWGDAAAPGVQTESGGAVTTATHTYPAGTVAAQIVATAVDAAGQGTVAFDQVVRVSPGTPLGLTAAYDAAVDSATLQWQALTDLAGTTYVVQKQAAAPLDGTGLPGAWTTIGTVPATAADGQQYTYSFTDGNVAPVADQVGDDLYRVYAQGPGSTAGAADGAQSAPTAPVRPTNYGGNSSGNEPAWPTGSYYDQSGAHVVWDGSTSLAQETGVSVSAFESDDAPPHQGPFGPSEAATVTVSNLPAHMSFGLVIDFACTDGGTPGATFTLSGPGTSQVEQDNAGVFDVLVGDQNTLRSASFTLTPDGVPAEVNGQPVTWTASVAMVSIRHNSVMVMPASLTVGGVYGITVYGGVDGTLLAPEVLSVQQYDPSVLQPLSKTVTLSGPNFQGTLLVRVVGTGHGTPLTLSDAIGDLGTATYTPVLPTVISSGTATVGTGTTPPDGADRPWFEFDLNGPSLDPVTLDLDYDGTTADPALYSGLGSTVTIPAGVDSYRVPVDLDYAYPKVSADQTVVVLLAPADATDSAPGQAYQGQRAELTIHDVTDPSIEVDGLVTGADVAVDPEGDDAKLATVTMQVQYWGKLDSTTITWDPSQDTLWPTRYIDRVGVDDLGSLPGAKKVSNDEEEYTWDGAPAEAVYDQADDGSQNVDSTDFGESAEDEVEETPDVSKVGPTAQTSGSQDTQNGTVMYWNNQGNTTNVTNTLAGNVVIGEGISLQVEYEGPIFVDAALELDLSWDVPGNRVSGYDSSTLSQNTGPTQWGEPSAAVSDATHFYWVDGGNPGSFIRRQVTVEGDMGGVEISCSTYFNVWRPESAFQGNPSKEEPITAVDPVKIKSTNVDFLHPGFHTGTTPKDAGYWFAADAGVNATVSLQGFQLGYNQLVETGDNLYNSKAYYHDASDGYALDYLRTLHDGTNYGQAYNTSSHTLLVSPNGTWYDAPDLRASGKDGDYISETRFSAIDTLMFRPTLAVGNDSIWVPLSFVDWDWSAKAAQDLQAAMQTGDLNGRLSVVYHNDPVTSLGVDTTTFPTWTQDLSTMDTQESPPIPPILLVSGSNP